MPLSPGRTKGCSCSVRSNQSAGEGSEFLVQIFSSDSAYCSQEEK